MYEEIGHGGAFLPVEVDEYVSLDITLIGPDYNSNEHHVGIIVSDIRSPYDWEVSNKLIVCAQEVVEPEKWNQQVAFHFSTDANAAYFSGNDLKSGASVQHVSTLTVVSVATSMQLSAPRTCAVRTSLDMARRTSFSRHGCVLFS